MYKGFLEKIFDLDENGRLTPEDEAMSQIWMHMFTKDSGQTEIEAFEEDEPWYDTDEDAFEEDEGIFTEDGNTFESRNMVVQRASDSSKRDPLREAIKRAGFDAADVDMLYEEEIQAAIEDAALDTETVLTMDCDDLREALLDWLDASLTWEMQLKQNILDAGLEWETLAAMSQRERQEALEEAGFEPEDFEGFCFI